jgi:UDP-N-acetylmuramyl pentapeptide phosphotransferase/UDP-N-acetylglucosamine-1-phosphate transferase
LTPLTSLAVSAVIGFGISAVASLALARTSWSFLPRDTPNARSLHDTPTPRTGGIAVLLGLSLALLATQGLPAGRIVWITAATGLLAAVSFLDDREGLPVGGRLSAQSIAAGAVVWGAGLAASQVWLPWAGDVALGAFGAPISFLGILWFTNLYNFMDGMDGFAAGMTTFGCTYLGFESWSRGDVGAAVAAFSLAAAAAGFLTQNRPQARIFFGDVGAIPIGFIVSVLALRASRSRALDIGAACLAFAPFVVDATITLGRRLLAGERVWAAHRSHYYQRFVLAGCNRSLVLGVEYALMVACAIAAAVWTRQPSARIFLLAAVAVTVGVLHGWLVRLEARASERSTNVTRG